jgi:hypothetical protein
VVGHVATAAGFGYLDAELRETGVGGHDVRTSAVAFDAQRNDWWVLQEEQQIRNVPGPPLLHQLPLQL